jgi:hypothetical protein
MATAQQKFEYYVAQIDKEVSTPPFLPARETSGIDQLIFLSTAFQVPRMSLDTYSESVYATKPTCLEQTLNRLEAQTSIPKAYAVLGVGAVFTFAIWFNIAAGFLSNFLGFALPAYFSLKALETPGHEDDIQWITYWIVFSSFSFVESFSRVLVAW